jgi:hypothetical protein
MIMRIVARGALLGLALYLSPVEAGAADTTATAASKTTSTTASKPFVPEATPEAKAQREKVMQVEKVAQDVSAKRDAAYLNEARERDKKRREEEAAAKTRKEAVSDSGRQEKAPVNPESAPQ